MTRIRPCRGTSPALAALVRDIVKAEAEWEALSIRLSNDAPETQLAWKRFIDLDRSIIRFRCECLADVGTKLKLDEYFFHGFEGPSELLKSVRRDTQSAEGRRAA